MELTEKRSVFSGMDREKVIKALECYCESDSFDKPNCKDCPAECMSGYMSIPFIQQVLAMLKEQEAHVLTLDEAVEGNGCYYVEFQYHPDRGWVKCDFSKMYLDGEVAMLFTRDKNFYQQKEHYGQLWRLWNKRPTYDQRQAVKWDE